MRIDIVKYEDEVVIKGDLFTLKLKMSEAKELSEHLKTLFTPKPTEECPVCKREEPHWHNEGIGWKMTTPPKEKVELPEEINLNNIRGRWSDFSAAGISSGGDDTVESIKLVAEAQNIIIRYLKSKE